jgi:hypothetical protein
MLLQSWKEDRLQRIEDEDHNYTLQINTYILVTTLDSMPSNYY